MAIELHKILIAALMITGLFGTIVMFYSDLNENYSVNNYYAENFSSFQNSLDQIKEDTDLARDSFNKLSSDNLFDILGGLKQGAYSGILLFGDSINIIIDVFTQGIGGMNLGSQASVWITIAATIILIIFFVAIASKYAK